MHDESAVFDGDLPSDYWEPYKKRGLYTISQASRLLAWRHFSVPLIIIERPLNDVLTDEALARALGFEDCQQVARAFELDQKFRTENSQANLFDEYQTAEALWTTRTETSAAFGVLAKGYEDDIIANIRAGRLRTVDRVRWESGAPYRGDPKDEIWSAKLLVLAAQINDLERELGSTLPPIGVLPAIAGESPSASSGAPDAQAEGALGNAKRWTSEMLSELAAFRATNGTKAAAEMFGISAQRVRTLLPGQKAKPSPFPGVARKSK